MRSVTRRTSELEQTNLELLRPHEPVSMRSVTRRTSERETCGIEELPALMLRFQCAP